MAAFRVDALVRRFGDVRAVDGLTFEIRAGKTFGPLGRNGAGRATTLSAVVENLRSVRALANLTATRRPSRA
jgi:ABC-2 type transport system ATP-binding protein